MTLQNCFLKLNKKLKIKNKQKIQILKKCFKNNQIKKVLIKKKLNKKMNK